MAGALAGAGREFDVGDAGGVGAVDGEQVDAAGPDGGWRQGSNARLAAADGEGDGVGGDGEGALAGRGVAFDGEAKTLVPGIVPEDETGGIGAGNGGDAADAGAGEPDAGGLAPDEIVGRSGGEDGRVFGPLDGEPQAGRGDAGGGDGEVPEAGRDVGWDRDVDLKEPGAGEPGELNGAREFIDVGGAQKPPIGNEYHTLERVAGQ